MQNHDYKPASYAKTKKLPPEHGAVLLRGELSAVEAPSDLPAVETLLDVLNKSGLMGRQTITMDEAMTVWRTVELARRISPDRLEMLKI